MAHNNNHGSYKVHAKSAKTSVKAGIRHAIVGMHKVASTNKEAVARTVSVPHKAKSVQSAKVVKTKCGKAM